MNSSAPRRAFFGGSCPILRVEDMRRSIEFYVGKLGFVEADWGGEEFTSIQRDNAALYLSLGDQGRGGAWVYVGVDDVRALYEECLANAVAVRMPPTNFPWALEIHVEDPDGNVIRFGSDPEEE